MVVVALTLEGPQHSESEHILKVFAQQVLAQVLDHEATGVGYLMHWNKHRGGELMVACGYDVCGLFNNY